MGSSSQAFPTRSGPFETPSVVRVCVFLLFLLGRAGAVHGNGKHGRGKHKFPGGIEFEGELDANGKPLGSGILTMPDGSKYDGEVMDGNPHGRGTLTTTQGTKFDCTWIEGAQGDYCRIKYADGDEYDGSFVDGVKHGKGTLTSASGAKYEGNFVKNMQHGNGVYYFPNGDVYRGEWANGKPDGGGALTWASGVKYVGAWLHGVQHGRGVITYPDGATRERQWAHGVEQQPTPAPSPSPKRCADPGVPNFGRRVPDEGTGPDGAYQTGDTVVFLCNEGFTLDLENAARRRTCGANGKWSGRRRPTCAPAVIKTIHSKLGDIYEGEVNKEGVPHGRGKLTMRRVSAKGNTGGALLSGAKSDKSDETSVTVKHDVYSGEFEDGKPHGIGTMTTKVIYRSHAWEWLTYVSRASLTPSPARQTRASRVQSSLMWIYLTRMARFG